MLFSCPPDLLKIGLVEKKNDKIFRKMISQEFQCALPKRVILHKKKDEIIIITIITLCYKRYFHRLHDDYYK